jgi:hypothetical protein
MFELAELSAATANPVPALRRAADVLLSEPDGVGVLLAGPILAGETRPRSKRHRVSVGMLSDGTDAQIVSMATTVLLVGGSARGKSYLAGVLAERLVDQDYTLLVIDPEGEQSGSRSCPMAMSCPWPLAATRPKT